MDERHGHATGDQLRHAHEAARLARWLDAGIAIPGTRWRIGAEAVIGLVPGVGDVAGLALGGLVLHRALLAGAPRALLLRMAGNLALDAALGTVPVLGDLFDFTFRANQRNARLLLAHLGVDVPQPTPAQRAGRLALALLVAALVATAWWWLSR